MNKIDKLFFNTSNETKILEIQEIFKNIPYYNIGFLKYQIMEILSADLEEVIKAKAAEAYKRSKVPIIVEHGALEIGYLKGYPGALSKPMWDLLNDQICELIPEDADRSAIAKSAVCFCDGIQYYISFGETPGKFSLKGRGDGGFQWDPIFIPNGSEKTYAEMQQSEKLKFSQAAKAYKDLYKKIGNKFGFAGDV